MIQGTGSNVGKSLVVAGLCRLFARRGLKVLPFKPQNMSNNAAVTDDGGEIGRAQALQAKAANVPLSVHMNPVLLKPETDTGAQVIVQGKRHGTMRAKEYGQHKAELLPKVLESFAHLERAADLIIVEGAGSPAETNLRNGDIANMGFAEAADLPVVLVGDIDRGGVIASLVGTHTVLNDAERNRIKAFLINRFRGDVTLFCEGEREIATRTGWASLGVIPWFTRAGELPAEDALGLEEGAALSDASIKVVVPVIGRIANFDDLDPLRMEPGVDLRLVQAGEPLPGDANLVLLPGSKSTIADLSYFREQGWDIDLKAHVRRGGRVIGLCGGYQMLGRVIADPDGVEGAAGSVEGLGLLDVETVLSGDKRLTVTKGTHVASGALVEGYEIHLGRTTGPDCQRPLIKVDGELDGATSPDGLVSGTYLHGLFGSDDFRKTFLADLGGQSSLAYEARVESALDALADHIEQAIDIDALLAIAQAR